MTTNEEAEGWGVAFIVALIVLLLVILLSAVVHSEHKPITELTDQQLMQIDDMEDWTNG